MKKLTILLIVLMGYAHAMKQLPKSSFLPPIQPQSKRQNHITVLLTRIKNSLAIIQQQLKPLRSTLDSDLPHYKKEEYLLDLGDNIELTQYNLQHNPLIANQPLTELKQKLKEQLNTFAKIFCNFCNTYLQQENAIPRTLLPSALVTPNDDEIRALDRIDHWIKSSNIINDMIIYV